ncbi:MAG: FxsA family protein [Alphaproteobacteria bacterium]|nr:MAG: FxsA family protein [Alphaproteobacteria bacterium]
MPLIILALILAIPAVELMVLINVGGEIGALNTIGLCLLTAAIGLTLVRLQGMRVVMDMQQAASRGEPIGASLVHGFFLAVAGVFLLIPGFVTDTVGALLLIPPLRLALARLGFAHFMVRRGGTRQTTIIIEGEVIEPDMDNTRGRQDPHRTPTRLDRHDPEN